MLSRHCFWRSRGHCKSSLWVKPNARNASLRAVGRQSNTFCKQPFGLSNNTHRTRWFSQTTISRKQGTELEHDVLSYNVTPGPSSPQSSPKPSPLDVSSQHTSLHSFQAHSRRTGLSTTSTVYTGTSYEYLTQSTLRPYGFDLYRVGGRGDRGVDLIGIWRIPLLASSGQWKERDKTHIQRNYESASELDVYETQAFKVLVQCKRLVGKSAKIGPHLIRELDGAVRGARSAALFDAVFAPRSTGEENDQAGSDSEAQIENTPAGPALGVLVSTKPATKGVVDSMRRSSRGLVWIMMEEITDKLSEPGTAFEEEGQDGLALEPTPGESQSDPDLVNEESTATSSPAILDLRGHVKQVLWNQAARDLGLEGVDVVKRYDSNGREEVVLMRGDRVWG
ncbi:hypothetical protein H2200_008211 [Cladophialophora chaetospira]|uniref:Required for respiratory growth protein 7, mitochondrial n=1 Tax=Cladophialophora chaetospira TaxID=386627 RepID=A0AA38X5Q1_9EURO|nr:hypothetical protein H2200_008211 [Cladophialophora chaetospira]